MKVKVSSFYGVHYLSKINNQNLLLLFVNLKLSKHDSAKTFIVFLEKERCGSLEKQVCFYSRNGDALKEQTAPRLLRKCSHNPPLSLRKPLKCSGFVAYCSP